MSIVVEFFQNGYAAILVFIVYLISLESLFSISLSVALTILYATVVNTKEDLKASGFDGSTMNWILLAFAVITPMSTSIGLAFKRREQALQQLSVFKSTMLCIYSSHVYWDWDKAPKKSQIDKTKDSKTSGSIGGRKATQQMSAEDWDEYADDTLRLIYYICADLTLILGLPHSTRARHRFTLGGQREANEIQSIGKQLRRSLLQKLAQLSLVCEQLKCYGLLPNEATRIRQWERIVSEQVDKLLIIKDYRTPQALRSFARLFSVFLPILYVPYYIQLSIDLNSIGVAIAFSTFTSLALTSLFETIHQMEDPFVFHNSNSNNSSNNNNTEGGGGTGTDTGDDVVITLDGIDIQKELLVDYINVLIDWRKHCLPNATKPFVIPDFQTKATSQE